MARPRRASRVYWREGRGFYADFRDFADVGGDREALVKRGQRYSILDRDEADALALQRLEQLQRARTAIAADVQVTADRDGSFTIALELRLTSGQLAMLERAAERDGTRAGELVQRACEAAIRELLQGAPGRGRILEE